MVGTNKLTAAQVSRLAKKYLQGTASEHELNILHEWYDTVNAGHTEMVMVESPTSSDETGEEIFAGLLEKIRQEKLKISRTPQRSVQWWYAAAAILLLISGAAAYRFFSAGKDKAVLSAQMVRARDVSAPQSARAVITLANGNKLFLDSLPNGMLALEGNTRVIKKADGQVVYQHQHLGNSASLQYNELVVPRGSKVVNLTLTDGTRVWLNAESSMRYPVAFSGNSRKVEITGEAYFEVSKDPERRFYVSSRGLTTEVLGTHFNVNTYTDELAMKVTLLEGSVHLTYTRGGEAMLKPGQQGSIKGDNGIRVISNVDTQAVMAWKNDHFMMKGTDLGALARQMARWYDIEVLFEREIPDRKFGGSISRNVNLSTMLRALKESGIESKLEGRKVVIQ